MNDPDRVLADPSRRFDIGALLDLLIILSVLVIIKQSVLPYSYLYAGPASTFTAMIVATILLRRRGLSWRDLGLRLPESWWKMIGLTLVSVSVFLVFTQVTQLIADRFAENVGTSGRFDHIEGDLAAYIGIMLLVWTHGSFFEELLFRAFVIDRTSTALGGGLGKDMIAVTFGALFFGYRHYYYQGLHGALITGAGGFAFGLLYIWIGRKNILPLVFAHGLLNSLAQSIRYLGIKD